MTYDKKKCEWKNFLYNEICIVFLLIMLINSIHVCVSIIHLEQVASAPFVHPREHCTERFKRVIRACTGRHVRLKARLRRRLHFRITSDGVRTCARAHSTALFSFAWQGRAAPRDVWGRQVVRYMYIYIYIGGREKRSSRAPCCRRPVQSGKSPDALYLLTVHSKCNSLVRREQTSLHLLPINSIVNMFAK